MTSYQDRNSFRPVLPGLTVLLFMHQHLPRFTVCFKPVLFCMICCQHWGLLQQCGSSLGVLEIWQHELSIKGAFLFFLLALSSNNLPFTFLEISPRPKVLIVQFLNSSALLILSVFQLELPGSSMSSPSTWRCTRKWKNCSSLVSALSWHQSFFSTIVAPSD